MLQATRGLVFHVSRYSDSSGIAKVFTEDSGLQSVVVKSLFSKKAKIRPALFGHLSLIDLVIDQKPGRTLNYVRDASLNKAFPEISDNIIRSSMLLFINEVLYKAVKEEEANRNLFDFIEHTLDSLNNTSIPVQMFHLLFLIRLSDHLGFGPGGSLSLDGDYFDMLTGTVEENNPSNAYIISGDLLALLRKLSPLDYPDLTNFTASRKLVLDLLNRLLDYYRIHLPEMAELKSVKVLGEIMG